MHAIFGAPRLAGRLVSEERLAEILDVAVEELRAWRKDRVGPRFVTLPNGQTRYIGDDALVTMTPEEAP